MNERIQALAEQAEKYASEKDGKYDGAGNLNWQWQDIKMEKFAELIIQECAKVARATPCPYLDEELRQRLGHTWDMASLEAGREIIKHFGAEE